MVILLSFAIKFLQSMDAFDCLVKNEPNFMSFPLEILNIIKTYYTENLIKEANEIINQRRLQNSSDGLFISLKEDIIHYGFKYSCLSNLRRFGYTDIYYERVYASVPESYNIVDCVLKNKWSEVGMYPPQCPILRLDRVRLPTPEWLVQLEKRLYLKYKTDFVHCLTQLKLFAGYFKKGDLSRTLQFGYNLGRLQEISSNPDYTMCFQQVIHLFQEQEWNGLDAYIDTLQKRFQIGYDSAILEKAN